MYYAYDVRDMLFEQHAHELFNYVCNEVYFCVEEQVEHQVLRAIWDQVKDQIQETILDVNRER